MADEKCSGKVYPPGRFGSFLPRRCQKNGTVPEGDKWFCGIHSTAAKDKREQKRRARRAEESDASAQRSAKYRETQRRAELFPELLEALKLAQTIIGHPDDDGSKLIAAAIAKATT